MKLTTEQFDAIHDAQCAMDYDDFYDCFHRDNEIRRYEYGMASHLWKKFVGYDHSLSLLYGVLDLENRRKLVDYINKRYKL